MTPSPETPSLIWKCETASACQCSAVSFYFMPARLRFRVPSPTPPMGVTSEHCLDQLHEEEMGTACPALNGCYHFATEFLVTGWIRQHSADYHTAERPCFVDSVVLHGLANTTIAEG